MSRVQTQETDPRLGVNDIEVDKRFAVIDVTSGDVVKTGVFTSGVDYDEEGWPTGWRATGRLDGAEVDEELNLVEMGITSTRQGERSAAAFTIEQAAIHE